MDAGGMRFPDDESLTREALAGPIGAALSGGQDAVVELERDEASVARYLDLGRLAFHPPEARAGADELRLFAARAPLVEQLGVFPGAVVMNDSILLRDGRDVEQRDFVPGYLHSIYRAHPVYRNAIAGWGAARTVRVDEPLFAPLHPWCKIYGHFLLEALPRLAAIRALYRLGFDFPVYVDAAAPDFITAFLKRALPEARLLQGERGLRYQPPAVLVPNLDFPLVRLSARRRRFIAALVRACRDEGGGERAGRGRLFLVRQSRAGSGYRHLENQDALRAIATGMGYEAVAPETLDVAAQVRLFAGARVVAGEYSSALHNTLFSPPGTRVVGFNWINFYQLVIAQAMDQRLDVMAPVAGGFVRPNVTAPVSYRVDEAAFAALLHRHERELAEEETRAGLLSLLPEAVRRWFARPEGG